MDTLAEIEEYVVRFEGRGPGTDAERRAARHLAGRLAALGRDVETEPVWIWPSYQLAHLINALVATLASIVSVANAAAGVALAAVATVSALGDLSGRLYLARRLTGRRASQSVVSRERSGKPGTLVLVAHYDAPRGGAPFGRLRERGAAVSKLLRRPLGPFDLYLAAIVAVLVTTALRAFGVTGFGVSLAQFIPTALLILSIPLFVDLALANVVPGAADNAAGVATALRLAERYGGVLDNFDLWVLLPGASDGLMLGMRDWLRRHRRELDPSRTAFLAIDGVGSGTIRYATREGLLLTHRYHRDLIGLCDQIAAEDAADENGYGARRLRSRAASDGSVAAAARFPAISISCRGALDYVPHSHLPTDTPDRVDPAALARAFGFCSELIELIDERIGPRLRELERSASPSAR